MLALNLNHALNHYPIADLPQHRNCKAILSKAPPKSAVVFIHGFKGHVLETWTGFENLAPDDEAFASVDLYFFGYEAFWSNTFAAASFLYRFLEEIVGTPPALSGTFPTQKAVEGRAGGYRSILLVAHSLGAVVTRWALVRASEEEKDWRTRTKLLLFAPAHCGSELKTIANAALAGFPLMKALTEGLAAGVPLVSELRGDSRILQELAARTRRIVDRGDRTVLARRVIIAEREIVVNNLPFPGDPFPDAIRDSDHITLCKPEVQSEALRIVASEL